MRVAIRDAELRRMPADAKRVRMSELVAETQRRPNGELTELDRKLAAYEKTYGVSSAEMVERVASGKQRETWDICQWLMTYHLRRDLGEVASRAR
jgi:hypothetical protein